jgi:ADP-ribosyl-[dinitrogen reductase] hydrolase
MSDLQDRLRGIAVGATVGDALGMPLEFHPPRPDDFRITEMVDGPVPAGNFTDDTEMALCLAESLLFDSPLNTRDLSARFTGWYQSRPSDVGIHTALVLDKIASGIDFTKAAHQVQAQEPDASGNGGVMRAWPLAIARHANPGLLTAESRIQCEITHTHPDSINGTLLFNYILYHILQTLDTPPELAIRQAIVLSTDQIILDPDFLLTVNLSALRMPKDLKNSGWVRHTIESALWAVQTTRSFEEALVRAVNLGNDADTSGCLTGAIAGAMYGYHSIPERWRHAVHGEYPIRSGKLWFEADFVRLADQLAALSAG